MPTSAPRPRPLQLTMCGVTLRRRNIVEDSGALSVATLILILGLLAIVAGAFLGSLALALPVALLVFLSSRYVGDEYVLVRAARG